MSAIGLPDAATIRDKAHHENFPVALRLLPASTRRHLIAFYCFARLVDDAGDEYAGDRLAALDELDRDVTRVFTAGPRHPVLQTLQRSVRELGLPQRPLRDLIEANRRDQRVTRYATFDELLGYCALSANPVGRLVLHAFGAATPARARLSDLICSALQLIEHVQDVAEDHARGRIYLPGADLTRFGCTEEDLAAPSARGNLRALVAFECERAERLLDLGVPLIRTLPWRQALAVAAYVAGGRAALAAIRRAGYDVLAHRPVPGRAGFARALLATWRRR
ncbi:squalene synthase HpnC [Nonomuraea sp. PA05]|uniref:squalene synthase HpnC n=1 Tax=Nonomuraea sp. PA05 TaxID=2604466 RepID=UPI0011DB6A23|nr:squalene synthase HpnC [Nonomuraea sp. PA05]TYB50774.1 squalene synthase HpnC [Nonomuraea sp. PA05]